MSDDEDDEDDNDTDNEFDDNGDFETIFSLNNYHSIERDHSDNNLSERKYLVADYNPIDFHTTTSIHNAQSDFSDNNSTNINNKSNCTTRLLGRNSIVPLMSQSQRRRATLIDEATASAINQTNSTHTTSCRTPSPILFLMITLMMTISATAMLCFAVMSDHWEIIRWDRHLLDGLTNNTAHSLHWHLDDRVARMPITRKSFHLFY